MDIEKLKEKLTEEMARVTIETKAARTDEMLHFLDGKHMAYRALLRWANETS